MVSMVAMAGKMASKMKDETDTYKLANSVKNNINQFFANSVVTPGKVVCCILFSTDKNYIFSAS